MSSQHNCAIKRFVADATHSAHVSWPNIRSMPSVTFYHFSVHSCADLYYYTVDVPPCGTLRQNILTVVLRDILELSTAIYRRLSNWHTFILFAYRFGLYFLFQICSFELAITTFKWRFYNFLQFLENTIRSKSPGYNPAQPAFGTHIAEFNYRDVKAFLGFSLATFASTFQIHAIVPSFQKHTHTHTHFESTPKGAPLPPYQRVAYCTLDEKLFESGGRFFLILWQLGTYFSRALCCCRFLE